MVSKTASRTSGVTVFGLISARFSKAVSMMFCKDMLIPSRDQGRLKPIQATLLQIFNSLFCHVKAISSAINMMSAARYTAGFRLSQDFQTACSREWNSIYFLTDFPATICKLSILPTHAVPINQLPPIFCNRFSATTPHSIFRFNGFAFHSFKAV